MKNNQEVPVSAAKAIAENFDKQEIIVLAVDRQFAKVHITTYGADAHYSNNAEITGDFLAEVLQVKEAEIYGDLIQIVKEIWKKSKLPAPADETKTANAETVGFYRLCGHSGTFGEIGNRVRCAECQAEVDEEFKRFWKPIIFPNGKLDIEEVKGNLLDFSTLIENAKEVYMHVTGGNIGKLNTDASAVISEADRQVQKQIDDAVEEAMDARGETVAESDVIEPAAREY